jgi:hypothetical protein
MHFKCRFMYVPLLLRYSGAAEHGHLGSQFNLALALDAGQGVAQDAQEAAKWLLEAANVRGGSSSMLSKATTRLERLFFSRVKYTTHRHKSKNLY